MMGTVTRVSSSGVYVLIKSILPGVELGPLKSVVHRVTPSPEAFSTYQAGDSVYVIEQGLNEFVVLGIVE